jgi:hypothetical protein
MAKADEFLDAPSADEFLGGGTSEPAPKVGYREARDIRAAAPTFRPTGGFRKQVTAAFEEGPSPAEVPTTEQLKQRWAESGKGFVAGVPGQFGDIEQLGRAVISAAGGNVSPTTFLPTTEEIGTALFGKPKTEQLGKYRTGGGMVGGLVSPFAVARGVRTGTEALIGTPSQMSANLAREAEALGFKLEPAQVREAKPMGSPGFGVKAQVENQQLANRLVSKETGKETSSITPEFVQERLRSIGDDLNKVYNREITIDGQLATAAREAAEFERQIGAASDPRVASIGENIFRRWEVENLKQQELQIQQLLGKKGRKGVEEVGEFVMRKFAPGERIDAPPITPEVWKAYQGMDVGQWNNLRPITVNAPEWAGDVMKVMDELTDKLGLRVRPGFYVGEHAGGTYGFTHPMGHIVLNERVLKSGKDAIETAIHEFGHQAEFQLFKYADPSVKKAITDAWSAENKAIPYGTKTVEQYRPITSAKYGEASRQALVQPGEYGRYIRNFNEWYAEQVSRWITTKSEPLTVVDKFFKGIADMWKAIYTRVVGHTPLTKEVDNFMRQNWEGKAIGEDAIREVFQLKQAAEPVGGKPVATPVEPVGKTTAKIDGSQLQALRSRLSEISVSDGLNANRARDLLQQIDAAIARENPKLAKQLAEANRKYTAAKTLESLIQSRSPGIFGGNVDLEQLGKELASRGVSERHPLYKLGQIGEQLQIRGRAAGPEYAGQDVVTALMGRAGRALSTVLGGRTQTARTIQRGMEPGQPVMPRLLGERVAAGTVGQEIDRSKRKKRNAP